jgi:hypothetical protein
MSFLKMIEAFFGLMTTTHGSELEDYIVSRKPQCEADIDRYTREFSYRRWQ